MGFVIFSTRGSVRAKIQYFIVWICTVVRCDNNVRYHYENVIMCVRRIDSFILPHIYQKSYYVSIWMKRKRVCTTASNEFVSLPFPRVICHMWCKENILYLSFNGNVLKIMASNNRNNVEFIEIDDCYEVIIIVIELLYY